MTRKKPQSVPDGSPPTADQIERLVGVVAALSEQVNVLRIAIDDLREEYGWAARQIVSDEVYRPVTHITSMPKDPCAADFGERVNRFTAEDLPPVNEPSKPPQSPRAQGQLW